MASKALHLRIQQAERELRELQDLAARMEAKLATLQKHLEAEEGAERLTPAAPATDPTAEQPPASPVQPGQASPGPVPTPPPLPPKAPEPAASDTPVRPTEAASPRREPVPAAARKAPAFSEPFDPTVKAPVSPAVPAAEPEREGLELQLGRVWFVRIGIGLLLTGIVFLSTYAYQNFIINWPAGLRVAILYLIAALLTGAGLILERWKENLRNYGRVVAAGGWAAAYYVTYAAHHVERLHIIENAVTAGILLTICALAFFAYAAWRKSSLLTVAALAMAFYSIAINPMGTLGCFSGLLLSAIAMYFFVRFRWMHTGFASLLGAYLSYAYWQGFVNIGDGTGPTHWFLLGYWLLFMTGVLVPREKQASGRFLAIFATLNNAFFFALFSFEFASLDWVPDVWLNALVFGGLLLVISAVLARLPAYPKLLWQALLPQGLALVTWGLSIKLTGYHLFISLTLEALVLAAMWQRTRQQTFRIFAWGAAGIAIVSALTQTPYSGDPAPHAAHLVVGALLAVFAFLMRGAPYLRTHDGASEMSCEALLASFFALLIPSLGIFPDLSTEESGLWMSGVALVLWGLALARSFRIPLPELFWLAQPYAVLGAVLTVFSAPTPTQLGLALVMTTALFHLHGWATDRNRESSIPRAGRTMEELFTLLALAALGLLVLREIDSPNIRILLYGVLAILLHSYGSLVGRTIATFSQLFYLPVIVLSVLGWNQWESSGPGKVALLGALGLLLIHLVLVHLWTALRFGGILREALLVLLTLLWAGWTVAFVDAWWLAVAWTGCALAFLPGRFRTLVHMPCYVFLLILGLLAASTHDPGDFLLRYLTVPTAFLVHLLKRDPHPDPDQPQRFMPTDGLGLLGVVSLTAITSQHTLDLFDSNGLSICWALLGLGFFALGLAARQRVYRLSGLILLGASLGHVLLVDVWKLGTLLRILSFLTLGLVLLALGFVYNRWSETLRKLL